MGSASTEVTAVTDRCDLRHAALFRILALRLKDSCGCASLQSKIEKSKIQNARLPARTIVPLSDAGEQKRRCRNLPTFSLTTAQEVRLLASIQI